LNMNYQKSIASQAPKKTNDLTGNIVSNMMGMGDTDDPDMMNRTLRTIQNNVPTSNFRGLTGDEK